MSELYDVEIKTPNKMFNVKGKMARSPVKFTIEEKHIKRIKMEVEIQGILDYTIKPHETENYVIPEKYKTKIDESIGEELVVDETKEKSILESLLNW